jgi:protein farnesyltransferase/geranylgeranyltransferase type-1 subunit alpha
MTLDSVLTTHISPLCTSYTLSQIERIPHNASAWNYLRALYKQSKTPLSSILHVVSTYTQSTPPVPFALEWMADSALESKTKAGDEEAMKMMQELGERWDPMRRSYWRYRRGEVRRRAVAATA